MRAHLLTIGKLKASAERQLVDRYADRFAKSGPAIGLELGKLSEFSESRAGNAATRKREEAALLTRAIPEGAYIVALDERGKTPDSEQFAKMVREQRDMGKRDLAFLIGGADGLDPDLTNRADQLIAFGKMTWPHQIARALLCEQLYRATMILSGHPYHRT